MVHISEELQIKLTERAASVAGAADAETRKVLALESIAESLLMLSYKIGKKLL